MKNNSNNTNNTNTELTFTGALQILFIALKLIGIINWSWLWVLSPTWISVIIVILLLIISLLILLFG